MLSRGFCGRGTFVSSFSFRLRSRALRGPPNAYALLKSVRSRDLAFESRRIPYCGGGAAAGAGAVDRCGACAVADGEWCGALNVAASRVSRWPRRGPEWPERPPVLRPPTAPAPAIARTLMPPRVQVVKALFAVTPFPFGFFRSLAVSLSLTIAELERRQLNAITSMFRAESLRNRLSTGDAVGRPLEFGARLISDAAAPR